MKSIPKNKTPRDKIYLRWIGQLPCCVCGSWDMVAAHHTESGGMGIKGSDYSAVPLCRKHHDEIHRKHSKGGFWTDESLKNLHERLFLIFNATKQK